MLDIFSTFSDSKKSNKDDGENGETSNEPGFPTRKSIEELMNVILANEGDYIFILSLSGKIVKETSSKPELRKAYLLLSTKVYIRCGRVVTDFLPYPKFSKSLLS